MVLNAAINPERESNLFISNYSFEIEAGDKPSGWNFAGGIPVEYGYITNGTEGVNTYKGTHAITMSNPRGDNGRWFSGTQVPQGKALVLAFWFKTEGLTGNEQFHPVIEWVQTGVGPLSPSFLPGITTNQDWTLYSYTIEDPPLGADQAVVTLKFEGTSGQGTVYIDEIYFGEEPLLDVTHVTITPNPIYANGINEVKITYDLMDPAFVIISVYNFAGNKLGEIFSSEMVDGVKEFYWDGKIGNTVLKKGLYILSINALGEDRERAITNKLLYVIN